MSIQSGENRGEAKACSRHPHRSGAATFPWFQLAKSVPIADDLTALHVFSFANSLGESAANLSLKMLVIEQRAQRLTTTMLDKRLQDGHRANTPPQGPSCPVLIVL